MTAVTLRYVIAPSAGLPQAGLSTPPFASLSGTQQVSKIKPVDLSKVNPVGKPSKKDGKIDI